MEDLRTSIKLQFVASDETRTAYFIPLERAQPMVQGWIAAMMQPTSNGSEEAANMSKLMKTAVKGVLIMYGDKLLTIMIGKDHPKPPKGSDIVEWYTNMFARIALAIASKQIYTVNVENEEQDGFTKVSGVLTIPLQESNEHTVHN